MGQFASNILLLVGTFFFTAVSGYPFVQFIKTKTPVSKIFLGFAIGFGIIALGGMIGNVIEIDFFILPVVSTLLIILLFVNNYIKKASNNLHETLGNIKENHAIYIFGVLATLVLVYLFSQIVMWTAGDGTFHSSVIRLIVEGEKTPVKLFPPGGNYENYPKGFHFYSAFFVKLFRFNVVQTMKTIPILITVITSLGIFSLTRELNFPEPLPALAFMVSFAFWKHFYPLVWMGYAQLTADFFLVALILIVFLELKMESLKLSFFIFSILYLIHPRHFLYSIPVLIWLLVNRYHRASFRNTFLTFLSSFGLLFLILFVLGKIGTPQYPEYITKLITGVESLNGFLFLWNIGFLAIFGIYFSLRQKNQGDWLLLTIFFSWLLMALMIDSRIFRIDIPDKRSYSKLFIPVSFFASSFLYRLTIPLKEKIKVYLVAVNTFLIFFLLITSAFINAPILGWVMAESDYNAMKSLQGKTGIAINVDPTGRWIYPLTGVKVTNPRAMNPVLNDSELKQIINFPNSEETFKIMEGFKKIYGPVYIFISQQTIRKSGYLMFGLNYPEIDFEEFIASNRYKVVYNDSAMMFEYENEPSRSPIDE
jgi:hypothetical protein